MINTIDTNISPITALPGLLSEDRPDAVNNLVEVELPRLSNELETWTDEVNQLAEELEQIGQNAINAISLDTIEDLATYTGTGLVIVKDINRGGTFIFKTAIEIDPNTGELYEANRGSVFAGNGGFWVRQENGTASLNWFDNQNDFDYYVSSLMNYANTTIKRIDGNIIVGNKPLASSTSKRDAIQVSRTIEGVTDCHGFADKTELSSVSDYGGYGTFDSTVKLSANNEQNHIFSFQDRVEYAGDVSIDAQAGLYSLPVFSGNGVWNNRYGAYILDVNKTGSGTLNNNIGVYVKNQTAGSINVGLNIEQTSGHAIYANGGAKSYISGNIVIGGNDSTTNVKLAVSGGLNYPRAFLHSTSTNIQIGGIGGDYQLDIVNNGASRLELTNGANSYTFRPSANGTQPLGDVSHRWSALYAASGTIVTSDDREKTYLEIEEKEILVAKELKTLIKKFKYNESIENKSIDEARIHFGTSAQAVKEVFEKHGLNAFSYALLCYDEWEEQEETRDEEENIIQEYRKAGNRYGLRYEELLCFIISAL